jgi:catechol 2,3-dioxygenase-like lactoylglutathione lyase family enzyme
VRLDLVTVIVRDYDEAIDFFTGPWASNSPRTTRPPPPTADRSAGWWYDRPAAILDLVGNASDLLRDA